MSLTAKFLDSKLGKANEKNFTDFSDGEGLVARWAKAGSVAWYLRYRWQGKQAVFKMGNYPDLSIKEARAERARCKALIDEGIDPRVEKKGRIAKNQQDHEVTLEKALNHWFDNELPRRRKAPAETSGPIKKYIIPAIGDVPVSLLTPQHWLKAFATMAHAPVRAGICLGDCKQALRYCRDSAFCKTDSLDTISMKMVGSKPKPRERVLTRKELRDIWDFCTEPRNGSNIKYCYATVIIMVMGARSGELRQAEKSDFNFDTMVWTVPEERSKTGHAIHRPIPPMVAPLIQSLIHLSGPSANLFPGRSLKCITKNTFSKSIRKISRQIGHENWSAHVFRHTLSTTFADLEVEPFIGEKLLGHTMGGVMAIYNKGRYLKQQAGALDTWINYISTDKEFDLYM